jgi:hypothetical protein
MLTTAITRNAALQLGDQSERIGRGAFGYHGCSAVGPAVPPRSRLRENRAAANGPYQC